MKFITIFGAGLLAFSSSFALSDNIFAIESTGETVASETTTESAKPTQAELRSVITRAESLPHYHEYSLLSAEKLATTTNLFREYTYLFKVVDIAKDFDANYDIAPAEDLAHIIKVTNDAVVVCSLLFGSTNQNSASQATTAPTTDTAQTPSVSTPKPTTTQAIATASQPQASSSQTSAPVVAQATPIVPAETQPKTTVADNSESSKTTDDIDIPATGNLAETAGTAEKSNKPLFITLGAVALACFLIGSMIILNRKKSYRPGRKF